MFGFSICNDMATRNLKDRIEEIHEIHPGYHLLPGRIASALIGAINFTDKSNWSSLHYSAYLGMEKTCFKLLKSGADINKQNDSGDSPLHIACKKGTIKCIETILQFKPQMNLLNDELQTPLFLFMYFPARNVYILEKLLHAGTNPNIPDQCGYSLLHILALQPETEKTLTFARLLLDYKANVYSETITKDTPLHYAVCYGNKGLVEVLLESGASINVYDYRGRTPMDIALEKRTRFPIVFEYLAKHLIINYCCGFAVDSEHLEEVCNTEKYQNFKEDCEKEIELFKSTFVGDSNVTYYKILVSSTETVAKYFFNSDILDSLVEIDTESNILWSRFLKNSNTALKRYNGMKLGIVAIRKIFPFLPDICYYKLMEYLDNDDFINLDKACSLC